MIIEFINIKIIDKFDNDRIMQIETTQLGAPKLVYNGSDDKYQPIMATEFSFNLTVLDKTDGKFFHLYTGNEKRYYVLVEDHNENMIFEGFLLPDFYEEPYKNGVIFVNLVATDGIAQLKGQYLNDTFYKKETSVIKLIAECLRFTKLEKNINYAPAILSAATDYKWNEITVNGATYLEGETKIVAFGVEVMPSRKSCYDILELLCKNLGCTLYAQGNQWYLEGINRKHETSQLNEVYTYEGVFIENQTLTKNIVDVSFFDSANVSILSPWKRVDVAWDIDEDGVLIPEYANYERPAFYIGPSVEDYQDFWKKTGQIGLSTQSENFNQEVEYDPISFVPSITSYNSDKKIYINRLVPGTSLPWAGENETSYVYHYVSIKENKKKYLKISDEYIERNIKIDFDVTIGDFFPKRFTLPVTEEEEFFNTFLALIFTIGNSVLLTTKESTIDVSQQFTTKLDVKTSPDGFSTTVVVLKSRTKATLKRDGNDVLNNGFFDLKIHAPISPDPSNAYCYGALYNKIKVEISALKKWEHSLTRNIDFTTVYKLEMFHGDSIADLTEKNFRFRRPLYQVIGGTGTITVLSTFQANGIYYYFIGYTDYALILNNPELFTVVYEGQSILMNDLTDSFYQEAWSVYVGGTGLFLFVVNTALINHPSGIGTDITDFNVLNMGAALTVQNGIAPEDNEWRESWKRYGQTESIRFGVALGKVYHDVQPGPLAVIEGTATTLLFPREITRFRWMDVKQFIPTRLEIDFSNGRTNVFMIESKHEIINDYGN
jgi:hypothetical protein